MQPNGQQHRLPVPLTAYPSFGMHPYAPPVLHPFGQPFVMQFPPPVMVPQQPPSRAQQQYAAAEEEDDDDDNYEEEIAEYGAGMDEPAVASTTAFSLLLPELQRAVAQEGYHNPTPIQAQAIPHLLQGRDILGCAQTGTGKTAAFTLPMLEYLTKHPIQLKPRYPRALILAPTRELAAQIGDSIGAYGRYLKVSHAVVFGGVGQEPQVQAVQRGLSILVATPGRLLDLMGQGYVHLEHIEIFVLDEADRMLDMGFLPDVKRVISALPAKRQSLFFSATLEPPVVALANTLVRNPVHITVTPEHPTVDRISQRVLFVDKENKAPLLVHILRDPSVSKVIVFTQMKHQANKVVQHLSKSGISAVAIHGNKSQTARLQALAGFKANTVRVLAATDIAARGLDIDGVSHVVNFDLPNVPETYVHRIGRTGRAGAGGDSISFCAAEERDFLRDIERFIRRPVPVDVQHPFHSVSARDATGAAARPPPKQQRGGRQEKRAGGSGGGGGGGGGGGKRGGGGRGGGFAGNAPQHAQGHSQPHAPHHPQSQVQQHAPAAQSHQGGGGGGGGGGGQRRGRGGRGGGGGGGGGGGAPRQAQQGQGQSQGGSRGGGGGGRGGRGRGQATGPGH